MKKSNAFSVRWPLLLGAISGAVQFLPMAHAQNLYYDPGVSSPSAWFGTTWSANSGGPYTSGWTDGNAATFNFSTAKTVEVLGSNVQLTGLTSSGAAMTLTGSSAGPRRTITFANGSQISSASTSAAIEFGNNLDIVGNFTLTSGEVSFGSLGTAVSYSGTATVNAGARIQLMSAITSNNANFVLSGVLRTGGGNRSLGEITLDTGGVFNMGAGGTDATNVTIKSLAGSGGEVTVRTGTGLAIHQLTIDQASNTTYSGTLQGVNPNGDRRLRLTKTNTGTLTLNGGLINLQEGTTVNAGTLLINGAGTRTFNNLSAANAITVASGGAFGGNAAMTIGGGENVVVQNGGGLIAGGGIGSVGTTSFVFTSGGNLDLSGVSSAEGWLHFDLGAATTAGTTFDQISLTGGNLAMGDGLLEFSDFSFNTMEGFGVGSYVLFAAGSHSGSLGSDLVGAIGSGYEGTLSLNGSNIVLNVAAVPEPQSVVLILAGFVISFGLLRRRRFSNPS